ncbi:MAG TPA: aminotransferase class I/II-fold pyridoxal phosphate-dependent enzyme [Cyclobacteriaceae bacterium]|nr:aminotransferase class I/II-fold pyridoxal phosphate-dependent enzyme [Cyclobacteriaceae bacterium]
MDISYILNELGEDRENYYNAVAPPVIQTSNFAFRTTDEFRAAVASPYDNMFYSRASNPTIDILRKKLAALDGAEDSLVLGTGIAAVSTPILSLLQQGDHLVSVAKPYAWARNFFDDILPKFGITVSYVDGTEPANFENAIRHNTRLVYLESPNSYTFELQDLSAISAICKKHGVWSMIDNTYSTPLFQQPHRLGIDLVIQSGTKYVGGHSDVLAGVVSGSAAFIKRIFEKELFILGTVISPWSAWLLLRGLRTLPIRMEKICQTTATVVEFLNNHPAVEKINFPFHPSFPQYDLAKQQMRNAGGLFSIVLKKTRLSDIETFCNSLRRFKMAVSWGGHESLVMPSAVAFPKAEFNPDLEEHRLVRFYIGLDEADVLIADLDKGLAGITSWIQKAIRVVI